MSGGRCYSFFNVFLHYTSVLLLFKIKRRKLNISLIGRPLSKGKKKNTVLF
uniref:Uncharacterized protein n=1 Tax=Anguilla anguilla TaxID=7936 RepID=A0A0E9R2Z1_ANGAN